MSLYVIKCVFKDTCDPKFYVGISNNVDHRIDLHLRGQSGVAWVNLHGQRGTWSLIERIDPVVTPEGLKDLTPFAENILTKEYMSTYGVQNVRGGRWSQVDLQPFVVEELNMEFRAAKDLCYVCGLPGHQSRNCSRGHNRMYTVQASSVKASSAPSVQEPSEVIRPTICLGSTGQSGTLTGQSGTSLWCTLNGPYADTINGNTVNYSGQRGGRSDHLVNKGAFFFYRATSTDPWTPCGPILESKKVGSSQDISKFELTISGSSASTEPVHGKKRACMSVGLRVPTRDKWEMSGIIQH